MSTEIINRGRVKRYFKGSLIPILLMAIGFLITITSIIIGFFPTIEFNALVFSTTFGCLLIVGGIVWLIVDQYHGKAEVEADIDRLIKVEMDRLLVRGMNKLSVVEEQFNLIDPLFLYGPSYDPNPDVKTGKKISGFLSILLLPIILIEKVIELFVRRDEPVWKSKVGSDGKWRYSLIEITLMRFDERQMYIYFAHLDLTTGFIFHEGTNEYFYEDICGINTNQEFIKVISIKGKRIERQLLESISIYTYGCSHRVSMASEIGSSILDKQFLAMRNLVRDKKMSGN